MERIGLVGPAPPWEGGITSFTVALATHLREQTPLRWLSWRPSRMPPPGTFHDGTTRGEHGDEPALGVWDRGSWERAGRMLHGCRAIVLTVSHPALMVPFRVLVRAYREGGGRVVLVCHNVVSHDAYPGLRTLATRLLAKADAAIVHAGAEAELARSLAPGIDVHEAFHPVYPDHAGMPWTPPPRARRLLVFGYVRPYKGVDDLIAALPDVPGATLEVVGRFQVPPARFERLAHRHGVADRVTLRDGFVPDDELGEVFGRADLVVAPYRQASQSGVVHLAYSFGRPVVATAVGGLAEAIVPGRTGLLVPPRDPASLALALQSALELPIGTFDPGIRAVLAERTWGHYVDHVLAAAEVPS